MVNISEVPEGNTPSFLFIPLGSLSDFLTHFKICSSTWLVFIKRYLKQNDVSQQQPMLCGLVFGKLETFESISWNTGISCHI